MTPLGLKAERAFLFVILAVVVGAALLVAPPLGIILLALTIWKFWPAVKAGVKTAKTHAEALQFIGEIATDPQFAGSLLAFQALCRAYKAGTITTAEILNEMWTHHRAFMERYPNITVAMVKDEYERHEQRGAGKARGR